MDSGLGIKMFWVQDLGPTWDLGIVLASLQWGPGFKVRISGLGRRAEGYSPNKDLYPGAYILRIVFIGTHTGTVQGLETDDIRIHQYSLQALSSQVHGRGTSEQGYQGTHGFAKGWAVTILSSVQ